MTKKFSGVENVNKVCDGVGICLKKKKKKKKKSSVTSDDFFCLIFFASTYLAMVSYDFDRSSDFFL